MVYDNLIFWDFYLLIIDFFKICDKKYLKELKHERPTKCKKHSAEMLDLKRNTQNVISNGWIGLSAEKRYVSYTDRCHPQLPHEFFRVVWDL